MITNSPRVVDYVRGFVRVYFDFDLEVLTKVKKFIPKGQYTQTSDKKYWLFFGEGLEKIWEYLEEYNFVLSDSAKERLDQIYQQRESDSKLSSRLLKFVDKWIAKYQQTWKFSNGETMKPYQHQIDAVKFLITRKDGLKGCILADDMGLGKTFAGTMTVKFLQDYYIFDAEIKPEIIIICPKSLKDDWLKAANLFKIKINLYTFAKIPLAFENKKYMVIADEAHAFQNISSSRTKKFLDLVQHENCLHVFPMTGTPMNNGRPSNIYPLLVAINHPLSRDKKTFERRYCDAQPTAFSKWDITGAINLDELSDKISNGLLYRTKEECLDLPEKIYIVRDCEETAKLEKDYNEDLEKLKKDYRERLNRKEIKGGGDAIVMLGFLRRLASFYKIPQTIEIVESLLEKNESVVIFSEFVESAELIAKYFSTVALTGKMKDEDRKKLKEDFQTGIKKVFVGTVKAGGVGITLTKACYNIIMDYPWTPGALQQAEDRIHRIGQNRTSFIYNLHAKEIDLIMAAIIGKKSEAIELVLKKHDIKLEQRDDDDFYPELLQKLLS
jgi:SNF2 family DNA or RNA helicase